MGFDLSNWQQQQPTDYFKQFQEGAQIAKGYQDKAETDNLNKMLGTGNLAGAQQQALATGHLDYVDKIDALKQLQTQQAQQKLDLTARIANAVQMATPDPEQRKALFNSQYRGVAANMGFSPDQLDSMDFSDASLNAIKNSALSLKDQMEMNKGVVVGDDSRVVNPYSGKTLVEANPKLAFQTVTAPDGSTMPFAVDPRTNQAVPLGKGAPGAAGAVAPAGTPAPAAAPARAPAGGDAGFASAINTVLHNEGSAYVAHDGNGAPVRFGINQGANPDVNVASLTRDQAEQIYKTRYWDKSQAPNLPANMQTPYFDVYVRNPKVADRALAQSGGDPQQFMQLADGYFQRLAQKPQFAQYAHAWANRDANNLTIATGGNRTDSSAPAASDSEVTDPVSFINSHKAGTHLLSPDELKAAGYNPGAVVQEDAKGIQHLVQKGDTTGTGTNALTPAAIESVATQVAMGGKMPALGMGKDAGAMRAQILNRAAELVGGGLNATNIARYQSLQASLKKAQTTLDSIGGAEKGVVLNAEGPLMQAAQRDIPTGMPMLNGPINYIRGKLGSDKPGDLETAIQGVANEYAKVMTGASGGSPVSDSARNHALQIVNSSMSLDQIKTNVARLKQEMTNRVTALSQQRDGIAAQIKGLDTGHHSAPQSAPTGSRTQVNIPQGALQMLKQNPSAQMRQYFDQKYGNGASRKILGQ